MNNSILYRDIAPGAAEAAVVSASGSTDFTDAALIPFGDGNVSRASFEVGAWGLDGAHYAIPDSGVAYWSEEVSDESGRFETAPVITITFSERFSSTGITLIFPPYDYCRSINLKWYRNNVLRYDEDFEADSSTYFCRKSVDGFDKLVITLQDTFLPYSAAKLNQVYIGTFREFGLDERRSVSVVNECNLITLSLPSSQLRWTLDSKDEVDYMFQFRQPVEAYINGELFCVYYVKEANRKGLAMYEVTCQDAFGVMDTIPFAGRYYNSMSAKALLESLIGNRFKLYITAADRTISGIIQQGSLREAVRQVLFAWGVCAATDGCDGIRVFDLAAEAEEIGYDRTFMGVSVKQEPAVTKVSVIGHQYTESANGTVEINGIKYEEAKTEFTVINPRTTSADVENVKEISAATMVSPLTGQRTAKNAYYYYDGRNITSARILWDGEQLGDAVKLHNEWGGMEYGNIEKLEMTLSNTLMAAVTVRQIEVSYGNYFSGELFAGEVDA